MKKLLYLIVLIVGLIISIPVTIYIVDDNQEALNVGINDVINTVEKEWPDVEGAKKIAKDYHFSFFIKGMDGRILSESSTEEGTSQEYNYVNRLFESEIIVKGEEVGTICFVNDGVKLYKEQMLKLIITESIILLLLVIYSGYIVYKSLIKPIRYINEIIIDLARNSNIETERIARLKLGCYKQYILLMAEEVNKARVKERDADRRLREVVASISHDIKNPISSIRAIVEMQEMLTDSQELKNEFRIIIDKIEQIKKMVSDLHINVIDDLGHLEVAQYSVITSDVREIFSDIDYKKKIRKYDISECVVNMDINCFKQVVENIIYNSYKYANTQIDITSYFEDEFLVVSIKDYGKGVTKDALVFLTQKYYRGEEAKNHEGSGIGLYMANKLMKAMGGKLICKSVYGENFEVLIYLKIDQ